MRRMHGKWVSTYKSCGEEMTVGSTYELAFIERSAWRQAAAEPWARSANAGKSEEPKGADR